MSVDFNNVLGFYVGIGSSDFPGSWSLNKPFGFDSGSNTPVFSSSFDDMINLFDSPITTTKKFSAQNSNNNLISSLTIEMPNANITEWGQSTLISSNDPNDIWCSIFKIIEYVFINQDVITNSSFEAAVGTLLGVTPSPYVANSIEFSRLSNMSTRVEFITFNVDFNAISVNAFDPSVRYSNGNIVSFNGVTYICVITGGSQTNPDDNPTTAPSVWSSYGTDYVSMKIYFNPDSLINDNSGNRYQVYVYEDEDGNNVISDAEWRDQIISKTINIFKTGRYSNYQTLSTKFVYYDTNNNLVTTRQLFVVYTISTNFTSDQVIEAIKDFLLSTPRTGLIDHGHIYTFQECVFHYPELFNTTNIVIYPVPNKLNGVGVVPVTYGNIYKAIVNDNSLNLTNNNAANAEVMYVGPESVGIINEFNFPLVCWSSISTDDIRPISQRYPNYAPMYRSFPGYGSSTDVAVIFHHLVYLALRLLKGDLTLTSTDIIAAIAVGYSFSVYANTSNIGSNSLAYVTFSYQGMTYTVLWSQALSS